MAVQRADRQTIGHVPRGISKLCWHFLGHNGKVTCEVTGKRKLGKGLEVPCAYKFIGAEKLVVKLKQLLSEKDN